jgi:predicted ATP-binding protein involved in virulence
MITKLRIKKLFNYFDYEIKFKEEGITILTGPNGYGKTTILKMLHALANDFTFVFNTLVFEEFEVFFQEEQPLQFVKRDQKLIIKREGFEHITIVNDKINKKSSNITVNDTPYRKVNDDLWVFSRAGTTLTTSDLKDKTGFEIHGFSQDKIGEIFTNIFDTYFIQEQRLIRRKQPVNFFNQKYSTKEELLDNYEESIYEYSEQLNRIIRDTLAKSSEKSQELDSSFPGRLFDEKEAISEKDFNTRFEKVTEIQKALTQFDLSVIRDETHKTIFKPENAKALLIYLNDTEQKLAVFDDLLNRLKLFVGILNERRFTNKQIKVSREKGFEFLTHDGNQLPLAALSSGEKQEVVLLYELLFKVEPGTLVLIDEPEISLHVVWQKEFLNDLIKVVELQKINVVVATHSPQIINDRWDLTVDLEECGKCENTLMTKIS